MSKTVEQVLEEALKKVLEREQETIQELKDVAKLLATFAHEAKGLSDREVQKLKDVAQNLNTTLSESSDKSITDLKATVEKRLNDTLDTLQKEMTKMQSEHQSTMNFVNDKAARLQDGKTPTKEQLTALIRPLIPAPLRGENANPKEAAQIAIAELWPRVEEALKKLESKIDSMPKAGKIISPRYVWTPWVDNFSSLTDGSTKTFYLSKEPRDLQTIKGWGSDFPHILHINTDFTISGKAVTLGTSVPAPTQGSTLIFEFFT